jgi:alanine-synthesizing transaminase
MVEAQLWKDQEVMKPRFSARSAWDTEETEWARALRGRRSAGLPIFDLTASNPTRCGLRYDDLLAPLSDPSALEYDPDPRGMKRAREAVCDYYQSHMAPASANQIFLTTSTSEAYSFLFRLLCDPGDEVLIAQPSYPLFDFLATLDDVHLVSYPLFYDYGWHLDIQALKEKITARTRAIALVHPNNPTGHFTKLRERQELESVCNEHGLALIVDEVFLDYSLSGTIAPSFASGEHPVMTFVLSGLSKIAALPQMKAAWIACFGPDRELAEALQRLEIVADTFLSMNAPIQCALPSWLRGRRAIQQQILERTSANLATVDELLGGDELVARLDVEAGWYAVLRTPALEDDEQVVLRLLTESGIAVHAGHFFGFGRRGWLVVSLLTQEKEFATGVTAILRYFNDLNGNHKGD